MQYASTTGGNYLSKFLAFVNSTVRPLSQPAVCAITHISVLHVQSWEPLQGTSSLFSHLGNSTSDGSAVPADSQLITTINERHVVQMVIDNLDDGDHPFHLHGQKFWIVDQGDGRFQGTAANNPTPMLSVSPSSWRPTPRGKVILTN